MAQQETPPGKLKITSLIILITALFSVFVFTSGYAFKIATSNEESGDAKYALVQGNVKKPGYYKLDAHTTNYDLLAKAELNDSSEIQNIDLHAPSNPEKALEVGVSETKVQEKKILAYSEPRVVYSVGKTSFKRKLTTQDPKANQALEEKDLLFTRKDGRAIVKFSNLAEVSLDKKTRVRFKKVPQAISGGTATLDVITGRMMLKVPALHQPSEILIRTAKAKIKVEQGDVELSIRASKSKTLIYVFKGEAKILRNEDKQTLALKRGERILIASGDLSEMVASQSQKAIKKARGIFSKLEEEYKDHRDSQKEVSILIVSKGFNFVMSLVPDKKRVILMNLPPNTYVGDYIDGVFRLDQSVALAGEELTREVIQRMIGRPLPYVMSLDIKNVTEFAFTIDGIMVEVDVGAAAAMGLTPGLQRLTQSHILRFLNPTLPGGNAMAQKRQEKILLAFLRKLKSGGASSFAQFLVPLLRSVDTNMPVNAALNYFNTYASYDNWQIINSPMPTTSYMVGPLLLAKPKYDEIQGMYN